MYCPVPKLNFSKGWFRSNQRTPLVRATQGLIGMPFVWFKQKFWSTFLRFKARLGLEDTVRGDREPRAETFLNDFDFARSNQEVGGWGVHDEKILWVSNLMHSSLNSLNEKFTKGDELYLRVFNIHQIDWFTLLLIVSEVSYPQLLVGERNWLFPPLWATSFF